MAIVVTLQPGDGPCLTRIPDPAGGTFDAAGDFDELLGSADLPVLGGVDPDDVTTFGAHQMAALIADVDKALGGSHTGPHLRGLHRLRTLAEICQSDNELTLRFWGD